jgi:hypothetical protein
MSTTADINPLDQFFLFSRAAIHHYQAVREGKLIIDCRTHSNQGGEPEFRLMAQGSLQHPFCFTPAHLNHYRERRRSQFLPTTRDEPFSSLETSVLEILHRTGYGAVTLDFKKGNRSNTILTCYMNLSQRYILSPK